MKKIGLLTFHYSNNYGGVLQCLALYKTIKNKGYDIEVIDFVPSDYDENIFKDILRCIIKNKHDIKKLIHKLNVKLKYSKVVIDKFNKFRENNIKMSERVDENTINSILKKYDAIIVGSDQIWNPSQRKNKEYFIDFGNDFNGKKISYAADSTISDINSNEFNCLKRKINEFDIISVRNKHTLEFVNKLTDKNISIVSDPTILYNFKGEFIKNKEKYILTYILGDEINGTHEEALKKIKKVYGDLPVYSIVIPTMDFKLNKFSDKVFYNISPNEWVNLIKNSTFVYTDSYHGVIFSIKFNKPFLAYYTEVLRASRFIDIGNRYNVEKYIVSCVDEIETKNSLDKIINFNEINKLIDCHRKYSEKFLDDMLNEII